MSDKAGRERLREAITKLNVPDKAFADAGGVTRQTLAGYLNSDREPTRDTLANWVKAYKLNAHWLLTGEGEMLLADHQVPLTHPLAQRVNQVALVMAESGADDLAVLCAARAMVDGEIEKVLRTHGGSGDDPLDGTPRAAKTAAYPARKRAAGDD